jgi:TRAP-type C4-dicarboxylate transport system permease small subunit
MMDRWERIDEVAGKVEQILLVILLSSMILVAFLQIVLRNFLATGLAWGDLLTRDLVLWVGFIGATLATKDGKHINIDVVSQWAPALGRRGIPFVTHLFSSFVCGLLTYAALKFIKNEIDLGGITFFRTPSWIPEIVLPIAFGLMTFRFGLLSIKNLSMMFKIPLSHQWKGMA